MPQLPDWVDLEMIAKVGAVIIALGTVTAALIGAFSYARFFKRAAQTFIFMKYTERYEQIMSLFPEDAHACRLDIDCELPPESPKLTIAVLKYLNLCSEEFYLCKRGYLDRKVWRIWESELRRTVRSRLVRREWPKLRKEFEAYPKFRDYVEKLLREPEGRARPVGASAAR